MYRIEWVLFLENLISGRNLGTDFSNGNALTTFPLFHRYSLKREKKNRFPPAFAPSPSPGFIYFLVRFQKAPGNGHRRAAADRHPPPDGYCTENLKELPPPLCGEKFSGGHGRETGKFRS